jgi:GH15 family glucan-1,4-alpha-glucosidase
VPLGNGSLLVNFDAAYRLRDLYWPHVGSENHTAGHPFRFGVWAEGVFRWISDPRWRREVLYEDDTLVTRVRLEHPDLPMTLECRDAVDFHEDLYVREIAARNPIGSAIEVRLFFAQDFHIGGSEVGDSAYYEPERRAVFHYKGMRWFLVNVARDRGEGLELGLDGWAVGVKEAGGREGAWRDAEDGALSGNAVAQGSVDSCVALHLSVPARGEARGWYWVAVGDSFREVTRVNRAVRRKGPREFVARTRHYWMLWATKECCAGAEGLTEEVRRLYTRSLLVVRTHIDDSGGVTAANDFDITGFARDTYSYVWPRDGALVTAALVGAGYPEAPRRFFEFCHRAITPEGYLLHKFNPDGSLASSWHGWSEGGAKVLPVQEDETALVLWALRRHWARFRPIEFLKPLYRGLVVRAANWLAAYRDARTGLPLPSWDLWEERRGVHAWTVAAAWAGLRSAAEFASDFGESGLAAEYEGAAAEIREGVATHLWLADQGRFARSAYPREDGGFDLDRTLDASLHGLWYFGMLEPRDPRVAATMEVVRSRLAVRTDVGGFARYEGDPYFRASDGRTHVPGNPWFISTLWDAQWRIAAARDPDDLAPALGVLEWCARHALPSGVMAEQIHPYTGAPLSVSPLTWSHATFVAAANEYLAKAREFSRGV